MQPKINSEACHSVCETPSMKDIRDSIRDCHWPHGTRARDVVRYPDVWEV